MSIISDNQNEMPQLPPRPKIAILTIYPFDRGGVLSMVKHAYKFCEQYFTPTLFFLGFDPNISANFKYLKFSSETRRGVKDKMNYVEIGARWAFWHPRHYSGTLNQWKYQLKDYSYFFVVSGTVFPGHPLTLLDKNFVVWAASSFEEDRKHRIAEELHGIRLLIDKMTTPTMLDIEKRILCQANYILPLSNYTKKSFYNIIGYEKYNVKTSGYPIKQPDNITPIKERDGNIIIAVGRFDDPRKNVDMLFRAFDRINQTLPDTKLYIIGNRPPDSKINEYKNLNSFKNVKICGNVSNKELEDYYQAASLFLLTSYQEGLGIAALDALARGVPVVATNCGGLSDYITNGRTGYLVGIDDDEAMHAKAIRIFQKKALYLFMSRNGKSLIREKFSEDSVNKNFIEAFNKTYPNLRDHFKQHQLYKKFCDESDESIVVNQYSRMSSLYERNYNKPHLYY